MAWISLSSVSVSNGDLTVSVTGSVDLSGVLSGWALIINNNYVEIKSGTFADINGNSTLTLSEAWDGSTITNQPAKIMPTSAPQLEIAQLMTDTNEYAIDVHNTLTEIATEDKDVTITDNTGTEHTFASMPKNSRLVQEAIQSGSDELASITADIKSQLEKYSVSKGDFFALAEQRKRESAGSGFLEWGKERTISGVNEIVASGLWTGTSTANTLSLGRGGSSFEGVSRSDYPVALVNGVRHKLYGTNNANPSYNPVSILFPEAEIGTRSYDSSNSEVFDYLTEIDPKYGDVASDFNEAVARNFEGLIKNGDFRFGNDANWVLDSTAAVEGDHVAFDVGQLTNVAKQYVDVEEGETYEISFTGEYDSEEQNKSSWLIIASSENVHMEAGVGLKKYSTTFTATSSSIKLEHRTDLSTTGRVGQYSVRKVSNQPVLSRQDFCFLETWHELVSEKDIFCPLGNAQYGSTSSDEGIDLVSLSSLGIGQGYSAFGEWDESTEGYVAKWSDLSTEEQRACLDNPDNNLYFDNEADELVQVRYRVRVVKGTGEDFNTANMQTQYLLRFGTLNSVYAQGKSAAPIWEVDIGQYNSSRSFTGNTRPGFENATNTGAYIASYAGTSYLGLCTAIPICLAHRGNQGAYHPVHNPEGYRRWNRVDLSGSVFWYDPSAHSPNKAVDCFFLASDSSSTGANMGTGAIGKATGRSDQYISYDAIYAGQVQDFRLNANKQESSRLMEDAIRKAVAGKVRGKEKQIFSTVYKAGLGEETNASYNWAVWSSGGLTIYGDVPSYFEVGDTFYLYDATEGFIIKGVADNATEGNNLASVDFATVYGTSPLNNTKGTNNEVYYILERELTAEYASLPWVDIIGSPESLLATFPDGVIGQWIPTIPDGIAKDFICNKKSNSSSLPQVYSDDYGDTFSAATRTIEVTTNSFRGALPSTRVELLYYEALSSFTEPDVNTAVYSEIGDVVAGGHYQIPAGNRLQASLTDTVSTTNISSFAAKYLKSTSSYINHFFMELTGTSNKHTPVSFDGAYSGLSAFKALYHLIEKDGLLYMQYHGRELQHNGTDWGDDSTVPIVDNESTMVDDNGNTVKTFTHTEIFPIGIADYTQTN